MRSLYEDIINKLKELNELLHVDVWNGQLDQLGDDNGAPTYTFRFPCAFVEIENDQPSLQLGDGVQLFDPLLVKIHIGHEKLNDINGAIDQNLEVFDLKQTVYLKLNKYEPTNAVTMIRTAETQQYDHTNVYHFIQTYTTNYIDASAQESTDGSDVTLPITLIIDKVIDNGI